MEKINHLCIGCGVCAALCPERRIEMLFDSRLGIFRPSESLASCDKSCGVCEKVCPFVPENPTTANFTHDLFSLSKAIQHDDVLGYYLSTQVGYSTEYRKTSASGGILTWILTALFDSGKIDHAISVRPDELSPTLFSFDICKSIEDIYACSGSCYQPVEFSRVLRYVIENEGRYAVTALPCMAKALRLAMYAHPRLRKRIAYILGLTCGQMKSRHFVNYIAEKFAGRKDVTSVRFRTKRPNHPASNFAFQFNFREQQCEGVTPEARTNQCEVGFNEGINRIWCERWFTPEACDYCDDVFAECADAVFMDAWLPDYQKDWLGTSLMVSRNMTLEAVLGQGKEDGTLICEKITPEKVLKSQEGVIFQKRVMAGCHYETTPLSRRIPKPRCNVLSKEHRKIAFVRRNVRQCLQNGPSALALKKALWFSSTWGWRLAKMYSMIALSTLGAVKR